MACKYLNKAIKRKDKGREGAREEGRGDGGTRALTQRNILRDWNKMCIFSAPENTTNK